MGNKLTDNQIAELAEKNGYAYAALRAIIEVESGGIGFSLVTGKIIIQFEPLWFKREHQDWKNITAGHTWENNGVSDQAHEWQAFNDAYGIDQDAAMKATSIGMMQVMGFHYKELGFETVGDMWQYAKQSEANQVDIAIRFIQSIPNLDKALKNKDWPTVAFYYNGSGYKKFNYAHRLIAAFVKHSQTQKQL
jgi:hypothetical protein